MCSTEGRKTEGGEAQGKFFDNFTASFETLFVVGK